MILISLIKTLRLKEVEKLVQITDSSNSDEVVHTFKLRTANRRVHSFPLSFTTPQSMKTFLFPFAGHYDMTMCEASRRNIFDIESP